MFFVLVIAAWICAFVYESIEKKRTESFLQFCAANADALSNGISCEFEGVMYTADTRLVRYRWCISILVLTMTRGGSFHAETDTAAFAIPTILTALGGWWGIPWGPINSVRAFIENGKAKSEVITVREIIFNMR